MSRTKKRKSGGRAQRSPDPSEILGLVYQRRGPLLYGQIAFFNHPPKSTTSVRTYKTSAPFIISETYGPDENVYGSVVSLIQEVWRLIDEVYAQLNELRSKFLHLQPKTVERRNHVPSVVDALPGKLVGKEARTYTALKKRLVGTLVVLSTQARNLFEIFPQLVRRRGISLLDYESSPIGTVALWDVLTAFIHHRYMFIDGEYVSDLFPGEPRNSPINRTFMGYKFSWVDYVGEIERAAFDIRFKHLTGRLRGWLQRLTLKSRYDEIVLLVQNLESFSRILSKKVGDEQYRNILALLFGPDSQERLKSLEPLLGGEKNVSVNIVYHSPQFKVHERLSEKMLNVECQLAMYAHSDDGRPLHADKKFETFTCQVKYEKLFELVNQAFGEDSLLLAAGQPLA